MKILMTAFDPFGGEKTNPALSAVSRMKDEILGAEIIKLEIPTVFHKSTERIIRAINDESPDVVISVGQAGGRLHITPERVAINVDDARIEDNEGNQPIDIPIEEDGEPAYFSTLPVKAMVKAMSDEGIPSSLSNSCGTFVCNHVMYGVRHYIEKSGLKIRSGFVHVPYSMEQVAAKGIAEPSLSIEDMVRALEAAVAAVILHDEDLSLAYGKND